MRVAAWTAERSLAVEERPEPGPSGGEVLVRVEACGICGSDLHFVRGELTAAPGQVPGHEIAGVVVGGDALAAGTAVAIDPTLWCGVCGRCRAGQPQTCEGLKLMGMGAPGGMQELLAVRAENVYALPGGVSPGLGALAEPLAVCVRGVHLAQPPLGARVLVLGAGAIGLLSTMLLADVTAEVAITARYPQQREAALKLGASAVFEPGSPDLVAWARERRPDAVIETVGGAAETLSDAVSTVRAGGTVVTVGVFTGRPAIPAFRLMNGEVRLVGSAMYGRAGERSEFGIAVGLLPRYATELAMLQTAMFPLAKVNEAFETAVDKRRGTIKVTVLPNG